MADISVFAEEGFEPKSWVNGICNQRQNSGETIDKFLAEMEMRLQLAAEEIEAGLHESSSQALRRIPFAVQEIYRLQGDIQGMQDQVKVLVGHASQDASEAANSVANIKQLDAVKRNMEAACSTLREATELSGMFIKVEDVFASGDLPRVAQLLRSMRSSLALVGDVPEFRAGRGKLRALEDRLQSQVEGALSTALALPPGSAAPAGTVAMEGAEGAEPDLEANTRSLCGLLLAVDRYSTIERMYVDARLARVHSLWEELSSPQGAAGAAISQWLPVFHARLLPMLRAEVSWAGRVLPQHRGDIINALLTKVFEKISRAITTRLSDRAVPITSLITLSTEMTHFSSSVADVLPAEITPSQRTELLVLLLSPLEDAVSRYPALESAIIKSELQTALPSQTDGGTEWEGEALVRKLWDAIRSAATSCCAAIERCVQISGGTELPGLASVLDEELTSLLTRITSRTTQAATKAGAAAASHALRGTHSMDESSEEVGTALRLVVLTGEAAGSTLLRKVDTALRAALSTALPSLQAAAAAGATVTSGSTAAHQSVTLGVSSGASTGHGRGAAGGGHAGVGGSLVDPVALRLRRNPERLQKVQKLSGSLADPRYNPLPQATHQADVLSHATHASALEALLARVKAALQPLPSMPQWNQRSSSSGSMVPSFSVEPLAYVTHLGDHLMMLPQQLEVLLGDELMSATMTQDEQDDMAAQWLDKVVAGAASTYSEAITRIPQLSPQGGVQLAADVEYFCNVMSALHVAPPPVLLTVQLFAALPDTEFPSAAKAALSDGGADAAALRVLATLRQLQLQP